MKNFLLVFILSFSLQAYSQTSLTQASDFSVTDVHGVTHNLFDYLDDYSCYECVIKTYNYFYVKGKYLQS